MTFSSALAEWQRWQESPWGRLRYSLAAANLERHLSGGPLRVLDLAGADGGDALRLAAKGHHVTIVDFTPSMLAAATERAAAAGLTVRCVEADVTALPADIVEGAYDLVLCHNLLQYQKDSAAVLAAAVAPLRPGGLLSVMAINRHAEAPSVARTHIFDTAVTLYSAEELTRSLTELGCEVVGHYGIDEEHPATTARIFQLTAIKQA